MAERSGDTALGWRGAPGEGRWPKSGVAPVFPLAAALHINPPFARGSVLSRKSPWQAGRKTGQWAARDLLARSRKGIARGGPAARDLSRAFRCGHPGVGFDGVDFGGRAGNPRGDGCEPVPNPGGRGVSICRAGRRGHHQRLHQRGETGRDARVVILDGLAGDRCRVRQAGGAVRQFVLRDGGGGAGAGHRVPRRAG